MSQNKENNNFENDKTQTLPKFTLEKNYRELENKNLVKIFIFFFFNWKIFRNLKIILNKIFTKNKIF